jgi:hypothetical protein
MRAAVALRLWGERALTWDIAGDLRCSKCRTAGAHLSVVAETRACKTGGDYWGPGPGYPELHPPLGLAWQAVKHRRDDR